jgi:spore coat protein CotH
MINIFFNDFIKLDFKSNFKKTALPFIILISSFLFLSCNDESSDVQPSLEGTELKEFHFLKVHNPSLSEDIHLQKDGNVFTCRVLYETDIENLIATFKHDGLKVTVNSLDQISEKTYNDFTNIVTYKVKTTDGREKNFDVDVTYFTGLPIVYLNTNGVAITSKDYEIPGKISINGLRNPNSLAETAMAIRGRGNSTWWIHPKKPYQLKFSTKTPVLGMPEEKKWIFLAEHSDKTLMRNKIAFEMGYLSVLDWTPKCEHAEVYLNNSYNGTYNITQKVEVGSNRVNIGSTGYLLEIDQFDRLEAGDVYFYSNDFLLNIKAPSLGFDTEPYNYIKNLIKEFETALHGSQFKDPNIGYAKYIDVDSFIDWYLISEITKNQDSQSFSSIYLNVIPGGKIKMGPLWDFDLAFGNVNYSQATNSSGFWVKDHKWFSRLFQDPIFVAKVKQRFIYFKNNQSLILEKMDKTANYLKWAQKENDMKWDVIGNYVWPNPVIYNTYEEEVNHLKNWYIDRMNWLTTAYNSL